jgi:hypothetical protein
MTSLERRIEALEGRTGPAIRLGVCVFLGESDDTAIRRAAAENGFAFEQIAAAVLFYVPECPRPRLQPGMLQRRRAGIIRTFTLSGSRGSNPLGRSTSDLNRVGSCGIG